MGVKSIWQHFRGQIEIPEELEDRKEPILVHLSDTPEEIYRALENFLKRLAPEYIVHTGDLVDNIKLEKQPFLLDLYEKKAQKILGICDRLAQVKTIVAIGNHDQASVAKAYSRCETVRGVSIEVIEQWQVVIGHKGLEVREIQGDYHLFGHDMVVPTAYYHDKWYLNGLEHIHVIGLKSGKIYFIDYPKGTNSGRMKLGRFGF